MWSRFSQVSRSVSLVARRPMISLAVVKRPSLMVPLPQLVSPASFFPRRLVHQEPRQEKEQIPTVLQQLEDKHEERPTQKPDLTNTRLNTTKVAEAFFGALGIMMIASFTGIGVGWLLETYNPSETVAFIAWIICFLGLFLLHLM
jgi:hypothetical protein